MTEWVCEGCGKALQLHELTRVGIGVHHYDHDKDVNGDGLLNCGLVKEQEIQHEQKAATRRAH